MRILVADDDPIQRDKLREALTAVGHEVVCVPDGIEAWERLGAGEPFELLITDWLMPGMDGVDLCRAVRALPREDYLPIVLLTARGRGEDLIEGLDAGADAFLAKPLQVPPLLAQIRVVQRILALEQRLTVQLRALREAKERLEQDRLTAAAVQASLLPREAPRVPGVEFAWACEPCAVLGGDMLNVFRLDERRVGLYVLDVSGHGAPASLRAVQLGHVLTPFAQQGGILKRLLGGGHEVLAPADVAAELNRRLPLMAQSGQFATFLYAVLELDTRRLRWTSAGHPGPVHVSSRGVRAFDEVGGIPIGIEPAAAYPEDEIALEPGDLVLLYTDGVSEARSPQGEPFGLERIRESLAEARRDGVRSAVEALRRRLEAFCAGAPRHDDATLVGLGLR